MIRHWIAAISLLSVPVGAQTESDNVDIGGLLEKKPCDDDKKKPEGAAAQAPAPKSEAPLQGFLETPPAEKKPEKKSLGAVPAMENCK